MVHVKWSTFYQKFIFGWILMVTNSPIENKNNDDNNLKRPGVT